MATETYNPRDKYYKQSVNKPLAQGPLQVEAPGARPAPTMTFPEFSRAVAGSRFPANAALSNYGKLDPEGAARLQNFRAPYIPGRFAGGKPLALPAPQTSLAPQQGAPSAIVPRSSGLPAPQAGNVIEGQFTRVPSTASRVLAYGSKTLPLIGDVVAGYYASQDPDGEGPKVGGLGRGLAGGLGSFLGRTAGAGAAVLTGPAAPATAIPLTVGGSIAGMEGGARLYDYLTQKAGLGQNPPPSSPEEVANYSLVNSTPAEQVEHETALAAFSDPTTRAELNAQGVFPGETSTPKEEFNPRAQVRAAQPVAKAEEKPAEFKGPSEAEMKRFRTLTGTKFDKNSVTDKLNLERMRAGEQTMTSKQSRQWRAANPTYRPGMYSRMKK